MRFSLHPKQAEVFRDPKETIVIVAGRRFGKSRYMLAKAIEKCLSFKGEYDPASPPVCVIAMPTLKQARQVHFIPLINLLQNAPFVKNISKSDYRITFKGGNKPDLLVRGVNDSDGDTLRGLRLYWLGMDEFGDFKPGIWEEALSPALGDTKGSSSLIIGTPKGKTAPLYPIALQAQNDPNSSYYHFITEDNPFISKRKLAKFKATLPPRVYRQEFEASFEDFEGAIFSSFVHKKHALSILPLAYDEVVIGCDWGETNPYIVVVGLLKDKFYIIDDWYNKTPQHPVLQDELLRVISKFCLLHKVSRCYLPDDRPASVLQCRRMGSLKEITGMRKAIQVSRQNPSLKERAGIGNSLFHQDRFFINARLKKTIDQFSSYHRAKDPTSGTLLDAPAKNQDDHAVDATMYAIGTICYYKGYDLPFASVRSGRNTSLEITKPLELKERCTKDKQS